MNQKLPARLEVDWNCPFPAYLASVSDGKGTANGGFLKRFRTHAACAAWLEKNGYVFAEAGVRLKAGNP